MNAPLTPPPSPPPQPPPSTAVGRLKDKLLHPWSRSSDNTPARLPAVVPPRPVGFPASIAEFLLVLRLRARRRSALSRDILETALRVVLVTCKHWFSGTDSHHPRPDKHD